jgi:hypothetical protein
MFAELMYGARKITEIHMQVCEYHYNPHTIYLVEHVSCISAVVD